MVGLLKKVKLLFKYFSREQQALQEFAIGMDSDVDCRRDLHILFLDYDAVTIEEVEESIAEIQEFWNLSDCFIYKTKNGFHAYFFYDIMPYSRVRQIIDFAKYVDDMFRYISRYYNYKTIRVAGKYKNRDISFSKMIIGKRKPTEREFELGDLKRKERAFLLKMGNNMLKKESLRQD